MLAFLATPTALVAQSPLSAARGAAPAVPALRRAEAANMIVVPPALQHGPKCTTAEGAPCLGSCASSRREPGGCGSLGTATKRPSPQGEPLPRVVLELAANQGHWSHPPPVTLQTVRGAIIGGAAVRAVETSPSPSPSPNTLTFALPLAP